MKFQIVNGHSDAEVVINWRELSELLADGVHRGTRVDEAIRRVS